jgi:hypothetical protein
LWPKSLIGQISALSIILCNKTAENTLSQVNHSIGSTSASLVIRPGMKRQFIVAQQRSTHVAPQQHSRPAAPDWIASVLAADTFEFNEAYLRS